MVQVADKLAPNSSLSLSLSLSLSPLPSPNTNIFRTLKLAKYGFAKHI